MAPKTTPDGRQYGAAAAVPDKMRLGSLLAVLAFSALLRAGSAGIPLDRDEGGYAYVAQRWLKGEVPYKESFEQKSPGVYFSYALIQKLIGGSPQALHWGAHLFTAGAVALVYRLGLLLAPAGALAGALFCALLLTAPALNGSSANTEAFMVLPLAGAFWAVLKSRQAASWRLPAIAGALSGCALVFRQAAVINLFLIFILLAWEKKDRMKRVIAACAGLAAVLLPVAAYFALSGAWSEFYDCTFGYNLSYGGKVPLAEYPARFAHGFQAILVQTGPILLLAAWGIRQALRSRTPGSAACCLWLAASFLAAAAGGYFRDHYFIGIVPALSLLAGLGVAGLPSGIKPWKPVLIAGALVYALAITPWYYLPGSAEMKSRRLNGYNPFPESAGVARFIAERSQPSDRVYIFGSEPQILYYAARRSASRYIYAYPLLAPFPETRERQREVLADISRHEPRFIVTVFVHTSFLASVRAPREIFSELAVVLKASYRVAGVVPMGSSELVAGEEVERLWKKSPMWYNTKLWGSLAVWERTKTSS